MCLEGETLLGAQPAGAGSARASRLEPTVLKTLAHFGAQERTPQGATFCFHHYYFK